MSHTVRGKFTPQFTSRYLMRDVIVNQYPEVLSILANHVLHTYAEVGVTYIEFSVSVTDLLKKVFLRQNKKQKEVLWRSLITDDVFSSNYEDSLEEHMPRKSSVSKASRLDSNHDSQKVNVAASVQATQLDDFQEQASCSTTQPTQPRDTETNVVENFCSNTTPTVTSLVPSSHSSIVKNCPISSVVKQSVTAIKSWPLQTNYLSAIRSSSAESLKPHWRQHCREYYNKNRRQRWKFLAAFNRTKTSAMCYPHFCTGGSSNENGTPTVALEYVPLKSVSMGIYYLIDLVSDTTRIATLLGIQQPVNSLGEEELLHAFAQRLCCDDIIEQIYPGHIPSASTSASLTSIQQLANGFESYQQTVESNSTNEQMPSLAGCVVGIDLVGDEFGFPFSPFTHKRFIAQIQRCRAVSRDFGVRVHAGEGLIRHSTLDEPMKQEGNNTDSTGAIFLASPAKAFMLHVYILMESMRMLQNNLAATAPLCSTSRRASNVRIGHGIAFLFEAQRWVEQKRALMTKNGNIANAADVADNSDGAHTQAIPVLSYFSKQVEEFRCFLIEHDIPCELNPTSNHMLLQTGSGDDHRKGGIQNSRTLRSFLDSNLPVVICTDDDGIWAISKCARHNFHVSVARELCDAIGEGSIVSEDELQHLISAGRRYAFCVGKDGITETTIAQSSSSAPSSSTGQAKKKKRKAAASASSLSKKKK